MSCLIRRETLWIELHSFHPGQDTCRTEREMHDVQSYPTSKDCPSELTRTTNVSTEKTSRLSKSLEKLCSFEEEMIEALTEVEDPSGF